MNRITSFAEANKYLTNFYRNSRTIYSLDNMLQLMEYLNNPQDSYRVVHVAGTSGKTSTAYYASALLAATGKKVGLTVSPHVDEINERVQIDGVPIDEQQFCEALTEFLRLVEAGPVKPSWFEVMIAFVYWYFAKVKVDYAVIEVGLGGLKDGTNVVNRADKACIITDIGLDHLNVLGNSLEEIAAQKIGIAHQGNHVFTHQQNESVIKVFRDWCGEHEAILNVVDESKAAQDDLSDMPAFQQHNWILAKKAFEYIQDRDNLSHLTSQVLSALQDLQIPGRMDIRHVNDKTIVMDGAHNGQKMTAFLKSFRLMFPDAKPIILISLKNGKEYQELIPLFKPLQCRIITTSFHATQDTPAHSMDPHELAQAFKLAGLEAESIPDQKMAFQELLKAPEKVGLITGSFYLLHQIRNNEQLV